jgi:hypothetical protein
MQLSKPPKPKATRKRLKKEILSDDFKTRKIFWKNIAGNFPYGKIFHLTSLNCHNLPTEFNKNLLTGSKVDRGAKSKAISQAYFFPSGREVG